MPFVKKAVRAAETRETQERPKDWVRPGTQLDIGPRDPNYAYRWNRLFITGAELDTTSINKRRRRGWIPVKPEEFPNLAEYVVNGQIFDMGNILCKCPKELADADVAHYEAMASGKADAATAEFKSDAHEYIPKFSERGKPRIYRGELPPTV